MKISNIILIAVVASATLIITTGALQMRFGDHKGDKSTNFRTEKIELSGFKYLVVNNFSLPINLSSGANQGIELMVEEGSSVPTINFHFEGDTLVIDSLMSEKKLSHFSFTLQVPEELEWIRANNASLHFRDYSNVELSLDLDRTRVSFNNNIQLKNLSLLAKNDSNVNANTGDLDTVSVEIDKSHITINGLVGKLKGSIKNNSTVSVRGINDFNFTKDNSSKLHHWN